MTVPFFNELQYQSAAMNQFCRHVGYKDTEKLRQDMQKYGKI